MNPSDAHKWLAVQETLQALNISRTTLHRRIKKGEFETQKRNGRLFVAVPLKQLMERPLEQSETTPGTSETSEITKTRIELEATRRERDVLRDEIQRLREDWKRSQIQLEQQAHQNQEALASVRALTEQNERLTILLANEQAHRMKALPRPPGWIARLFGRRSHA